MATKPESVVFVLDVGPLMHPHLELAARAAGDFMTQKMLYRPKDQVCLLLFGASETHNRENDKSAQEPGGEGEYAHIVEAHDLGYPDGDYIKKLHTLKGGHGHSDFKEALAVAASVLVQERANGTKRRIVLLSNLCCRAQEDPDDALASCLAEGLQQREIMLDVLLLDVKEDDERYEADKVYNLNQLAAICQELSHRERHFPSAVSLLGAFPAHEVTARATGTGYLSIGTKLNIRVKWSGKTMKEKFPPAGKESAEPVETAEGVDGGLEAIREYFFVDQDAHGGDAVPNEEVGAAYRYGANLVPVDTEAGQQQLFKFPAEKSMKLLGFLPEDAVPRHLYMADCKLVIADKDSQSSGVAMAALVEAMARQRQKAVVRLVPRDGTAPQLHLAAPVRPTATSAPHLLLNALPFMEDMRDYRFPSFTKKTWAPSEGQLEAAAALVGAMSLGEGELEQLLPERTADPALHRLYYECGRRVVQPDVPLQEEDVLEQEVFEPHPERQPGAAAALQAAQAAFPMGQAAKASRKAAVRVSTEDPEGDYKRLMEEGGDPGDALDALASAIHHLVCGSMGSSKFQQGVNLVDLLRDECVLHNQPEVFNTFLESIDKKCKADETKAEFWKWLSRREVRPIDSSETPASQLDPAAALTWYSQHTTSHRDLT